MKTTTISDLKTHLSRYLRRVRKGERFLVRDRNQVVAELGPAPTDPTTVWERLVREEGLRLGSQDWGTLKLSRTSRPVPIGKILEEVREDSRW